MQNNGYEYSSSLISTENLCKWRFLSMSVTDLLLWRFGSSELMEYRKSRTLFNDVQEKWPSFNVAKNHFKKIQNE